MNTLDTDFKIRIAKRLLEMKSSPIIPRPKETIVFVDESASEYDFTGMYYLKSGKTQMWWKVERGFDVSKGKEFKVSWGKIGRSEMGYNFILMDKTKKLIKDKLSKGWAKENQSLPKSDFLEELQSL